MVHVGLPLLGHDLYRRMIAGLRRAGIGRPKKQWQRDRVAHKRLALRGGLPTGRHAHGQFASGLSRGKVEFDHQPSGCAGDHGTDEHVAALRSRCAGGGAIEFRLRARGELEADLEVFHGRRQRVGQFGHDDTGDFIRSFGVVHPAAAGLCDRLQLCGRVVATHSHGRGDDASLA